MRRKEGYYLCLSELKLISYQRKLNQTTSRFLINAYILCSWTSVQASQSLHTQTLYNHHVFTSTHLFPLLYQRENQLRHLRKNQSKYTLPVMQVISILKISIWCIFIFMDNSTIRYVKEERQQESKVVTDKVLSVKRFERATQSNSKLMKILLWFVTMEAPFCTWKIIYYYNFTISITECTSIHKKKV